MCMIQSEECICDMVIWKRGEDLVVATSDVLVLSTFTSLFGHGKVSPLAWSRGMFEWFPPVCRISS